MAANTSPSAGFQGVTGTPLCSWMKLTHSSTRYASSRATTPNEPRLWTAVRSATVRALVRSFASLLLHALMLGPGRCPMLKSASWCCRKTVRLTQTLHAWRPCQHTATGKQCRRPLPILWGSMTGWRLGALARGLEDVGAEGSEKQDLAEKAGLKALPRIGLCEVGIVGRLPAPGRLTRRLSGLRAKCDRPNLTCRRERSLRLRKLPTRRHAKAALGGASLRLLRVSLFGAGQGLWPRDRRRTWFS